MWEIFLFLVLCVFLLFIGKDCDVNINECESNPCKNNGTCIDEIAKFSCACQPGFTSNLCEVNVDECQVGGCYLSQPNYALKYITNDCYLVSFVHAVVGECSINCLK